MTSITYKGALPFVDTQARGDVAIEWPTCDPGGEVFMRIFVILPELEPHRDWFRTRSSVGELFLHIWFSGLFLVRTMCFVRVPASVFGHSSVMNVEPQPLLFVDELLSKPPGLFVPFDKKLQLASHHLMDSIQVTPTTEDSGSLPFEKGLPPTPSNPDDNPLSQSPAMPRKLTRKSEKTKKVYIAVLGATGAGKTTVRKYAKSPNFGRVHDSRHGEQFINTASNSNLSVGTQLNSCTDQIQYSEPFLLDGRIVTLVDTPGFDDTSKSDAEILNIVCKYFLSEYQKGHYLTAVIYLHRISDNRMSGSALRNFHFFEQLCGNDAIKNSAIVTNMWGNVDPATAKSREEELRTQPDFFRGAIEAGAKFLHHKHNTQESAHAILSKLITNTPVALGIQRELLDERKSIALTTAGHTLLGELATLVQKHEEEKKELQADLIEAKRENDDQTKRELEEAIETLQNATAKLQVERERILESNIAPEQKNKLLRKLAKFGFATLRFLALVRPRKITLGNLGKKKQLKNGIGHPVVDHQTQRVNSIVTA
ncbi:hypothetical protein NLI96_g5624 [Meripilus lineatus]|uniref:G domain-containing protein n=1 Tax=Meripilus lineatus TaxID=2056292 RepID=A0AAD5YEN2_9APHY|nr:hypothetical protein NLI96_g5624 [Physisporinus lineatus]